MNGSCRGVYPAEFFRRGELIATQRPSEKDLGVANVLFDIVIRIALLDLDLRKLLPDAFAQPRRRAPQREGMMDQDQQFHWQIGSSGDRVIRPTGACADTKFQS